MGPGEGEAIGVEVSVAIQSGMVASKRPLPSAQIHFQELSQGFWQKFRGKNNLQRTIPVIVAVG